MNFTLVSHMTKHYYGRKQCNNGDCYQKSGLTFIRELLMKHWSFTSVVHQRYYKCLFLLLYKDIIRSAGQTKHGEVNDTERPCR